MINMNITFGRVCQKQDLLTRQFLYCLRELAVDVFAVSRCLFSLSHVNAMVLLACVCVCV